MGRPRLALWLLFVACGGSGGKDETGPDGPLPSFGSLMPQVQKNGSDIIADAKIMVIDYGSADDQASDVETTAMQLAASSAWGTQTSQYGVNSLTALAPQHIPGTIPTTLSDSTLQAMLGSNLGGSGIWGSADPNTIYEFLIPASVAFDDESGSGDPCCGTAEDPSYTGYHFDTVVPAGADVPYAVLCECPDIPGVETSLQDTTSTLGHETVEAATDPREDANGNPTGWAFVQNDFIAWEYGTDVEIADMCEDVDTQLWTNPPGMTFALQRTYSNEAAAAGTDPCVGDPFPAYYQTIPEAPDADTIDVTIDGSCLFSVATHLNKIAVGASGTVKMHVFASGSNVGPFTVTVQDISGDTPALLDITSPTGTYMAGDEVSFEVKVAGSDANVFSPTAEPYMVTTSPAAGSSAGPSTYYYAAIGQ
jgi:hypothetical protein